MKQHGRHSRPDISAITWRGWRRMERWSLIARKANLEARKADWQDLCRQEDAVHAALKAGMHVLAGRHWLPRAQILKEAASALHLLADALETNDRAWNPERTGTAVWLVEQLSEVIQN